MLNDCISYDRFDFEKMTFITINDIYNLLLKGNLII